MKNLMVIALALLVAGCSSRYSETPLTLNHPANVAGAAAPAPERSRTLDLSTAEPVVAPAPLHNHGVAEDTANQGHAPAAPEKAAVAVPYTCPMHPEVVSDAPARCPKCNMKLVPQKKGGQ